MIRIKRVRIVYDRLPLDPRQAATLSRQVLAQVQRALEGGPSGRIDRLSPPTIRVSPDGASKPEIVRRTAGAIRQEIAHRLKK
ncbi:MAG: hypothetical protein EPO39_01815 [Candidatus Manganitrophaceae bacterium]|nr:MAG: hypothetical protein EPO39_01815 [Candidatus Manganitrophaceae bacterium]